MANVITGYQTQNFAKAQRGLRVFVANVVKPKLVDVLIKKARELVTAIDGGQYNIPIFTGNLSDATGCAIYADGTIRAFIPTKKAIHDQACGLNGTSWRDINGNEFLTRTIQDASARFSKGIWFVIFSAVPYAVYINQSGSPKGRGQGFFEEIVKLTTQDLINGLRPVSSDIKITSEML